MDPAKRVEDPQQRNGPLVPTASIDAVTGESTYTGNFSQLGYIRIVSTVANEKRGEGVIAGGSIKLKVTACNDSRTLQFNIREHKELDVMLPSDVITCAGSKTLVARVKTDPLSPNYTITWNSPTVGANIALASTVQSYENQLSGVNGIYKLYTQISDDRCVSDITTTNITLGSATATNGAWNSGVLSDDRLYEVESNVQLVNNTQMFMIGHEKGSANLGIVYYDYTSILGWKPKTPFLSPTSYLTSPHKKVRQGTNSILNIPSATSYGFFYIGVDGAGNNSHVRYITAIESPDAITAGNTHNDVAELFDIVAEFPIKNSDVYYRRSNGYLGYYEGLSGNSNDFLNEATKFDVTINGGRVFYINNAGGLYYKPVLTSASNTTGVVNIPNTSFTPYTGNATGYTDIVFDNSGNLYYVRQGQLYVRLSSESFSTERPTATTTVTLTGNFSINKGTGTLYCVGANRAIYQIFPSSGNPVIATTSWGTKKATVGSNDYAGTYPIFAGEHLFYIAKTNSSNPAYGGDSWAYKSIFNLYYTDACTPSPYRKSLNEEDVMNKELADFETNLQADVYPNPFKDEITLEMEGTGDAEIKLYNGVGKVVKTLPYAFGKINIDTEGLKEGLYTLSVYQDGKRLTAKKIVK